MCVLTDFVLRVCVFLCYVRVFCVTCVCVFVLRVCGFVCVLTDLSHELACTPVLSAQALQPLFVLCNLLLVPHVIASAFQYRGDPPHTTSTS